ncbi:MAG: ribosome assembly factor SBDS, partial [Nitrososphaerota archaeon]
VIGKSYGLIRNMGKIVKEEWRKDGSWVGVIEIPTGLHYDLVDKLSKISSGRIETVILEG